MNFIAEQTNVYSVEKSGTSINTNKDDVEIFFAVILYSGIVEAHHTEIIGHQKLVYHALLTLWALHALKN